MPTEIPVHFFKEGVRIRLQNRDQLKKWILQLFRENNLDVENINYVFCSDRYLLKMNKNYLDHHYLTDIITFDNSVEKGKVEADVFISTDRVAANAKKFNVAFRDELHRVLVHGALHLAGYDDKKISGRNKMREAEDYWLKKRRFLQK